MLNVTSLPDKKLLLSDENPMILGVQELLVVLITLCLLALLFVVGIGANSLLLVAFYRRPILQTVSNRFVGNLVAINLISTVLFIPLICIDISPTLWIQWTCHPVRCIISELVSSWVSASSILGTLLIGVDQYLAILFPLRYAVFFRGYRAWLILSTCWISCLIFSTIVSISEHTSIWLICDSSDQDKNWTLPLLKFIFLFVVPVILIGLIYSRIYLEARASSEKLRKSSRFRTYSGSKESLQSLERSSPAIEQSTSFILMSSIRRRVLAANQFMLKHKEELHTARISLLIVVLILGCWLPFHLENLLLRLQIIQSSDVPKWLRCLTHLLVVIYPSLSPCLFAFRCKKLQRELRRTLQSRRRHHHPELSSYNREEFRRKAIRKFPLECTKINIDSESPEKVKVEVAPRKSISPPTSSSTESKSLS